MRCDKSRYGRLRTMIYHGGASGFFHRRSADSSSERKQCRKSPECIIRPIRPIMLPTADQAWSEDKLSWSDRPQADQAALATDQTRSCSTIKWINHYLNRIRALASFQATKAQLTIGTNPNRTKDLRAATEQSTNNTETTALQTHIYI